ncbi:MAG TPA: quinolinate synthase NadA [Methanospirillum sp.]|uniref:quinolinate synthase NadA n=1 Tax=Methanospirillum sp. TaxID=45200 RepID=UPI002B6ABC3A|nr:quinolinate synthase NadA [Methanospirillum sp.]HWQ64202.1 quinolinate synthase NadA [Methanospirillum sp.]
MMPPDISQEIRRIKTELNAKILAHNYQIADIQAVADVVGDSLELALAAKSSDADILIVCGVRFMAETAKILNPDKRVFIPVQDAGCPLADFLTPELIVEYRQKYPDAAVVVYVNSSAACKATADIVCTSGNAVAIVKSLPNLRILFGPDANLAGYVQEQVPEKKIIIMPTDGHCYVHQQFSLEDINNARKIGGIILAHPECPEVVRHKADIVASTGKMIKIIRDSNEQVWHIFTEEAIVVRLRSLFPDKKIFAVKDAVCKDMRKTSIEDLIRCIKNLQNEITLEKDSFESARRSLDRMLEASVS